MQIRAPANRNVSTAFLFSCLWVTLMAGRKKNENPKPGIENLIPTNRRSKEEVRANARKGGIKSGIVRREKKTMVETLELFLSMPLKDGDLADVGKLKSLAGARGENLSVQEGIILAQTLKALKGDARSAAFVMEILAKQEEKQNDVGGVTIIDDFTDDE